MTSQWIGIIASAFTGFVAACIVQYLVLRWQEHTQKKLLRKSLYRELATIYLGLRDLLPHFNTDGPARLEPSPANLPKFVDADCFNTYKSSAVFWRLEDAFGISQAHRNFAFLAVPKQQDVRSAAIDVSQVLNVFRGLFDAARLCRRDLVLSGDGQVTEMELTAVQTSTTAATAKKAWHKKGFRDFGPLVQGVVVAFWVGVGAWLLIERYTRRRAALAALLILVLIGVDLVESAYKQRADIAANRGVLTSVGIYAVIWTAGLISMAYLVGSLIAVAAMVAIALTVRLGTRFWFRPSRKP